MAQDSLRLLRVACSLRLRFASVKLSTRLLPMQVLGKQATSTAYMAKACLRMLSLEAQDISFARRAVRSLLSDMGVESGLWCLPSIPACYNAPEDVQDDKCFPGALPLADADHLLHHCMSELELGFAAVDKELWADFDAQLGALAKVFSKRDHIEKYIASNIHGNSQIPAQSKRALSTMFSSTCPTYNKSRWHFAFDVLHWLSKRQALIDWLEPMKPQRQGAGEHDQDDLSKAEGEGLRRLASDPVARAKFWAIFWATYGLHSWGFKVHTWLHRCPCPNHQETSAPDAQARGAKRKICKESADCQDKREKHCRLAGRRLIELSCGKASAFMNDLHAMQLSDFSHATSALEKLRLLDAAMAEQIKCGFVTAKHKILLRFEQGAAYYAKFPWNIVKLLGYIVAPGGQARERAIQESKAFAAELCGSFDSGQLPTNTFAQKFFQEPLLLSLRAWADDSNNRVTHEKLFSEVLSYGLSLVSVRRLEGRRHLVNLKVAPSRASTATTISAALRRRQNRDVYAQTFRDDFEHNLQNFQLLVPESWSTMAELHRLISGQHLEIMFQDVSHEELVIRGVAGSGPEPFQDAALVPLQQHVKTVLKEGRCYAVPVCADGSGGTVYHILQLLSSKPSAKKYIERVVGWGDDKWAGQVAVASLGRFVASAGAAAAATVIDLEASVPHDAVWQLAHTPQTTSSLPVHLACKPIPSMVSSSTISSMCTNFKGRRMSVNFLKRRLLMLTHSGQKSLNRRWILLAPQACAEAVKKG